MSTPWYPDEAYLLEVGYVSVRFAWYEGCGMRYAEWLLMQADTAAIAIELMALEATNG